jgi:hypothetical protein
LDKKKIVIQEGVIKRIKLKNASGKVKWSSTNKKIATVTSKGKIKGVHEGTAYIVAKYKNKKYKCKVTVKANSNSVINPETTLITLQKGESCAILIHTDKGKDISYHTSNKGISLTWGTWIGNSIPITVTANWVGESSFYISDSNNSAIRTQSIKVIVNDVSNSFVEVDTTPIELLLGESKTLWIQTDKGAPVSFVKNDDNISLKFGDWAGTSVPITITAKASGKSSFYIVDKNNASVKTANIEVNVAQQISCTARQNFVYPNRKGGMCFRLDDCQVEQRYASNNKYTIKIFVSGEVLCNTNHTEWMCYAKLYDESGTLIESSLLQIPSSSSAGDTLKDYCVTTIPYISLDKGKKYTITFNPKCGYAISYEQFMKEIDKWR